MGEPKKEPIWFDEPEETKRFPGFQGTAKTDVLIIGGGITGILTAWQLHQDKIDCILLDKQHLVTESTGYTTALVSRSPDIVYHKTLKRYGPKKTKVFLEEMEDSQKYLRQLVRGLRIQCDWSDCNGYFYSREPSAGMSRECEAIISTKMARRLTEKEKQTHDLAGFSLADGTVFENEARFHPRKFLFGLLKHSSSKGLQVYEDSEVTDLKIHPGNVEAILENGNIDAKRVILAGRTNLRPHLINRFLKKKTYLVYFRAKKEVPFTNHIFWDNEIPYNYFRQVGDREFLLGGRDRERSGDVTKKKAFKEIKELARELWPDSKFETTRQWQGTIFETADMIPFIGVDPKQPKILAAQGYAGCGMVGGTLASRVLAGLITKDKIPGSEFLGFNRQ